MTPTVSDGAAPAIVLLENGVIGVWPPVTCPSCRHSVAFVAMGVNGNVCVPCRDAEHLASDSRLR